MSPRRKVVEANLTAHFRGWPAFIALQIEYSLLERSVVQELVPMARGLGLGITPLVMFLLSLTESCANRSDASFADVAMPSTCVDQ